MKRFLDKTWAKITAFFLAILFALICGAAGAGIVYLAQNGVYLDGGKQMQEVLYYDLCYTPMENAAAFYHNYESGIRDLDDFAEVFRQYPCSIVITDTKTGEEIVRCGEVDKPVYELSRPASELFPPANQRDVTVTACLSAHHSYQYHEQMLQQRLLDWRYGLIVIAVLALALALFLFIFQLASAGHWQCHEGIHLTWFDRIPLDVYLAVMALLVAFNRDSLDPFDYGMFVAVLTVLVLLGLLFPLTLAANCKADTVLKNLLVVKLFHLLVRGICFLASALGKLSLIWQTALGVGLWLLLTVVCAANSYAGGFLEVLVAANVLLALFLLYLTYCLRVLQKGGEALAEGDLDSRVDTSRMFGDFRRHGEHLNAAQEGVQKAVEARMKSERLKTELITNVSHDIKTPLTSIVNYVDLLKKEEIHNPTAAEYIDVLDRQSARLRKLTEDLVEASKAATGNIAVNWEDTDVNVLLGQVAGEYAQRLEACTLTPVLTLSEASPLIRADGRLLWRILDNLMSNACKYAMPGTRVYLSTAVEGDQVVITAKNISHHVLNVSADELTERFVRGDSSRSTEGSGLGLSIANSLTAVLHGEFSLAIDGDLFKVTLTFPRITNKA